MWFRLLARLVAIAWSPLWRPAVMLCLCRLRLVRLVVRRRLPGLA